MISVQDAVNSTLRYIQQFEKIMPTSSVRLEEFEFDDGQNIWVITMSFGETGVSALGPRSYKTFLVHAENGQVISMRIRNPLAGATGVSSR